MFENTLAPKTKQLLHRLDGKPWLKNFYLAGGTALALHYGHRQSVDLDWFTPRSINTTQFIKKLSAVGPFEILSREKNTLEGILTGVKVSFMTYPYRLLNKPTAYGKLAIAAPLDIAIMKLGAIADRNTKKDFIDLFIFLEREKMTLDRLLSKAEKKFAPVKYDRYHLLKSLTYFTEANSDAMPKMFIQIEWKKVKQFFTKQVQNLDI